MSQRALLLSCRDILRGAAPNGLALPAAQCDVTFDGQPPPVAGELFIAVHPGDWTTEDIEGLSELYGIDLTVTVRVAVLPRDRQSTVTPLAGAAGQDLDQWLEKIRALLHLDRIADQWLNAANAIVGAGANGFVEPPRFRGCSRPEPKGPDWFSADTDVSGRLPPVGLAQTLHFGGAKRVQTVESEE